MNKSNSLFDKQLIKESLGASVRKLDPRTMIKNPIMFTVEIVTAVMFVLLFYIRISGDTTQGSFGYNLVVFVVLFITLLFANFAEAIAEGRFAAQNARGDPGQTDQRQYRSYRQQQRAEKKRYLRM